MEGSIASSDTGTLNDRLTTVEERVQFNNDSIKEVYSNIDKLDVEMKDIEDELAGWMEREIGKVYDIINDNPLGK
jgi:tetrahydromethanopterin S-methyltransferase subunit G